MQRRLDPLSPLLVPYLIFLLVAIYTLDFFWLFLTLGVVLLYSALKRAAQRGRPSLWARPLTPNFYAVRCWNGRWSIFQRPAPAARTSDCHALIRDLIKEQSRLPAALSLFPGKYQAITHDTVIRRLRKMEHASDIHTRPIYSASMASIYSHMTGGRCKKCSIKCQYSQVSGPHRQFYLLSFAISQHRRIVAA